MIKKKKKEKKASGVESPIMTKNLLSHLSLTKSSLGAKNII